MIPNDRRYLESHEWAMPEGDLVSVGITDFAVQHLTDLVFVDLPGVGDSVQKGERFGEIESVKAVSDLNSPISGEVVEVNAALASQPEAVNEDCYGEGWMIAIDVEDESALASLMDAAAYIKFVNDRSE